MEKTTLISDTSEIVVSIIVTRAIVVDLWEVDELLAIGISSLENGVCSVFSLSDPW